MCEVIREILEVIFFFVYSLFFLVFIVEICFCQMFGVSFDNSFVIYYDIVDGIIKLVIGFFRYFIVINVRLQFSVVVAVM